MLEVEGGTDTECLRILRHEAGHALDTAFRLHFKRQWREHFGSFAQRYPDFYKPKPKSRRYVLHLPTWYAQAHPAEDFAETFAVWLTPRSRWRRRYRSWSTSTISCTSWRERSLGIARVRKWNQSRKSKRRCASTTVANARSITLTGLPFTIAIY